MSSQKVIALSAEAVECGKKISETKKKFVWKFRINEQTHTLQLISSALSGKRVVSLNHQEIYSQQNLFNINFDFNHSIKGHSIRIIKGEEGVNLFDLRIDNRSFDYLMKKKKIYEEEQKKEKKASKYEQNQNDPFSQFATVAKTESKSPGTSDPFGDFADFDDFSPKKTQHKKPIASQQLMKKQKQQINFFGEQEIFNSNSLKNMENNLNNQDLLSGDFSTNAYSFNHNYNDLVNSNDVKSDEFGVIEGEKKQSMSGKQIMNKAKATAQQIKLKASNNFESLI